jgi:hypothetical protein
MVASELGKLYRQVRKGEVDALEGSRMAQILSALRQCLEASDLEARLARLEQEPAPAHTGYSSVDLSGTQTGTWPQ